MTFLEKLFLVQIFISIDFEAYVGVPSICSMNCARDLPMQSFTLWEILPVWYYDSSSIEVLWKLCN